MGPLLGSSSLFLEMRHDAQCILGNHEFLVGWNHDDFNWGIVTGNEALFDVNVTEDELYQIVRYKEGDQITLVYEEGYGLNPVAEIK